MPQSLPNIAIHILFSVKDRERCLDDNIRERFHAYAVGVHDKLRCPIIEINSEPDHVHILCGLSRTMSLADLVEKLKASTSAWMKTLGKQWSEFRWQDGYAAFSVSRSQIVAVGQYIREQQEYHRGSKATSFQDELRLLLTEHRIEFDERDMWD